MNSKKKYFRVWDRADRLIELREKSVQRGLFPGFDCLWDIFSLVKGYPLFVAGMAHSGKTEFVLEIAVFTAQHYDWKWFMYLGETGNVDEIIAELAYKYIGKPYRKKNRYETETGYHMTDAEVIKAHHFIEEHFVFCDLENEESAINSLSLKQFYELASEAENEFEIKFDGTIFDPFNDAEENLEKFGGREDKYLKDVLRYSRISSKKNKRIDILVNHIGDIKPIIDKSTGMRYVPPALPTEWAGGRTWHRRAFTMLLIYRPPAFMKNRDGTNIYQENETIIYNQKSKPKGSGKIGHCSLFWDWMRNRYYEDYSSKIYAHKKGEGKTEMCAQPEGILVENKTQKQNHETGDGFAF